ncbi:hypothetical protein ACLBXM_13665 [Xanthobacteraceae bacterium A53D]
MFINSDAILFMSITVIVVTLGGGVLFIALFFWLFTLIHRRITGREPRLPARMAAAIGLCGVVALTLGLLT